MADHAVVVAGGGPTGLMLAGELTLAGIDVVIVERRASQELDGSRAGGLHPARSRCSTSVASPNGSSRRARASVRGLRRDLLDISDFPTRHNYLSRSGSATSSASWPAGSTSSACRSFVAARWWASRRTTPASTSSCPATRSLRAEYLVGCDGGRSVVRKAAGIDFAGWDPTTSCLIAEVEMAEEPEIGMRPEGGGIGPVNRAQGGGPYRVVLSRSTSTQQRAHPGRPPRALVAAYGTDYGVHSPTWISRFTDMTRQAASYRAGRVLLAATPPTCTAPRGQGLNTGVQDAVNLGWKLARW